MSSTTPFLDQVKQDLSELQTEIAGYAASPYHHYPLETVADQLKATIVDHIQKFLGQYEVIFYRLLEKHYLEATQDPTLAGDLFCLYQDISYIMSFWKKFGIGYRQILASTISAYEPYFLSPFKITPAIKQAETNRQKIRTDVLGSASDEFERSIYILLGMAIRSAARLSHESEQYQQLIAAYEPMISQLSAAYQSTFMGMFTARGVAVKDILTQGRMQLTKNLSALSASAQSNEISPPPESAVYSSNGP